MINISFRFYLFPLWSVPIILVFRSLALLHFSSLFLPFLSVFFPLCSRLSVSIGNHLGRFVLRSSRIALHCIVLHRIASYRIVHRFIDAHNSTLDACMSSSLVSSSLSPSAIGSFGGGSAAFFANAPPARPEANYIYDLAPASSSSGSSGQNAPSTSNQFPYYSQQQMIDNCAAYAKRLRERQQHERYGTFDEQDSS